MKKIVSCLLIAAVFSVFADERADLLRKFAEEDKAVQAAKDKDFTTIELTSGSIDSRIAAESQLRRALDYKLRHTANAAKRLELLKMYAGLNAEKQQIFDAPREGTGSLENFIRNSMIESLTRRFTDILMADEAAEKRWDRISQAEIVIDRNKIKFVNGRASFFTKMYNRDVKLEINVSINNTFTFDNRDFAIFLTDQPGSLTDDFATLYIAEFRKGKAVKLHKCQNAYYEELTNKNGIITVRKREEIEKIDLKKVFPR